MLAANFGGKKAENILDQGGKRQMSEYSSQCRRTSCQAFCPLIDIRSMADSSLVAHLTLGWHLGRGGIMSAHIVGNVFLLLVFRKINSQSLEDTQVGY